MNKNITSFREFMNKSAPDSSHINEARNKVSFTNPWSGTIHFNGMNFTFVFLLDGASYYKDIGSKSHSYREFTIFDAQDKVVYTEKGNSVNIGKSNKVAVLNYRDGNSLGRCYPVVHQLAANYFKGNYNKLMELEDLKKIETVIGHTEAKTRLSKSILKILGDTIKETRVEGSLFMDNTQQKSKSALSKKISDLGLSIDTETRSVIEFSGSLYDIGSLEKLVDSLNNGSYFI